MRANITGVSCVGFLIAGLILMVPGSWMAGYVIETWGAFFGNPVEVPLIHPATLLIGAILFKFWLPLAVITWFVGLFLF